MNINPNAPHFVLAAVKRVYIELPELVGRETWSDIQIKVDEYLALLEAQPNAYLASTQLFGLLAQHEKVRQRIVGELKIQEIISANIIAEVTQVAYNLGFESTNIEGLIAAAYASLRWEIDLATVYLLDEEVHLRGITISEGGIGGASKVNFTKVHLDLGSMSGIAAGFVTTSVGIITAPNHPLALPLLVIASLLSTISALYDAVRIEISEQEASVFWGMVQAVGNMHGAGVNKTTILSATNSERAKYGLDLISEAQLQYSLVRLERIKSIKKVDQNYYRIIEQYTVKD